MNSHYTSSLLSISEFLAAQSIIRVHFESMPYGMGNQVSSYNLMRRFRQLGFSGKFECIYFNGVNEYYIDGNPERNGNLTKEKLITLFNLPANLPDVYHDDRTNSDFIEGHYYYEQFKENKTSHLTLAISGGQLNFCTDAIAATGKSIIKTQDEVDSLPCKSSASSMDVDVYLRIGPWLGNNPSHNGGNVQINLENEKKYFHLKNGDDLFITAPKSSLEEVVNYLNNIEAGKRIVEDKPGLLTFTNGLIEKKFHAMPFYGWPIQEKNISPKNYPYINTMAQYLAGIRDAQVNGPASLTEKPIILPIFHHYDLEASKLKKAISNEQAADTDEGKYFKQLQVDEYFSIGSLSDSSVSEQINNLEPGEIFLLSMGELPLEVFNGLYVHGATLPPVHEGENTRHMLIYETSKPFFRSREWSFTSLSHGPVKYYPSPTLLNSYLMHDTTTAQEQASHLFIRRSRWISQFIRDSLDPESEVCNYFSWMHNEAQKPENDRIIASLERVITILAKKGKLEITQPKDELLPIVEENGWLMTFWNKMPTLGEYFFDYLVSVTKENPAYFPTGFPTFWNDMARTNSPMFFNVNNTCVPVAYYPAIGSTSAPSIL